jgi:ribosome-binding protein aMBF1 (putative translation factor)
MRNAIYRLVADDINEASIIGRKLARSSATSSTHVWLWNAMAKHPLSQTCRQIRQEFDPIHRHRAIVTGVTRYRLELENFNVARINDFADLIESMPKVVQDKLREAVGRLEPIIRYNLTDQILPSICELGVKWRDLYPTFSKLRRALDATNPYSLFDRQEVNPNFKAQAMSITQKKVAPTHDLARRAKAELKKLNQDVHKKLRSYAKDQQSVWLLSYLSEKLEVTLVDYFKSQRCAREERASKALEQRLEIRLKAKLREELKAELREEIINELKGEAWQIQAGFEGWNRE